ncbi:MAG TPA: HD-GYP domain-containing protein [Clostridiaceae bacterium]|nr:HD-GYP domain-containing protein [Clostridiaceae bacterium]
MKSKKMLLPIEKVNPGMITAEVVFNKMGNVMLWDGVALDSITIERLKNVGVQEITVHVDEPREKGIRYDYSSPVVFAAEYEQDANLTKQMFQDISSGKRLDAETTEEIVDSVLRKSESNRNIIDSITQVRSIDEYTFYHSLNVSMLCMLIGKWLRLDEYHVRNLALAGLLHDIGKTRIPFEILNKPGKLTDEEFEEMKRHSEYGYNIVKNLDDISPEVAKAILTHHEKEDGSGYPMGLTGDKLNLYSKVITVADIFDAMTANRTYKSKDTPFKVFELMQHGSFGILDPIVLNAFLNNVTSYYIGANVLLNTGETGVVVFMNKQNLSRPVVQVGDRYIDTSVSKFVRIKEFL